MRNVFKKITGFQKFERSRHWFEYHTALTLILSGEKIMQMKLQALNSKAKLIARAWIYAPVIAMSLLAFTQPTLADITNTATASGTSVLGAYTSPDSNTVSVDVINAAPNLTVTKTVIPASGTNDATIANGSQASLTDAGDTITYQYVITNTGNVTISGVTPVDSGPLFGTAQVPGTGIIGLFSTVDSTTLAPLATATFTMVYQLSAVDAYLVAGITTNPDAVNNSATATGVPASGVLPAITASTVTAHVEAGPMLSVVKAGTLTTENPLGTAGQAEVGEIITYTYTVTNVGNVAITNVSINDLHEGSPISPATLFAEAFTSEGPLGIPATADATPSTGTWDVIQPGAVVTFTYVHTVTQTEVDGG
jgi:uncharacterized repeat protein (TIGR01451 family)